MPQLKSRLVRRLRIEPSMYISDAVIGRRLFQTLQNGGLSDLAASMTSGQLYDFMMQAGPNYGLSPHQQTIMQAIQRQLGGGDHGLRITGPDGSQARVPMSHQDAMDYAVRASHEGEGSVISELRSRYGLDREQAKGLLNYGRHLSVGGATYDGSSVSRGSMSIRDREGNYTRVPISHEGARVLADKAIGMSPAELDRYRSEIQQSYGVDADGAEALLNYGRHQLAGGARFDEV